MRLIDADALLAKLKCTYRYFSVKFDIEDAPTIDPEELRPKGEWVLKDGKGNGVCSHCNRQDKIDPLATHCRYCGAKMG